MKIKDIVTKTTAVSKEKASKPPVDKEEKQIDYTKITEELKQADDSYKKCIDFIRTLLDAIKGRKQIKESSCIKLVSEIHQIIISGNKAILLYTRKSTKSNYLYAHSANSLIMSLFVGSRLNLQNEELTALGVASFLHDIGMMEVLNIVNKESSLTHSEWEEVKKHPFRSKELLKNLDIPVSIFEIVSSIIVQHHERLNGTGYPLSLKEQSIGEFAKILQVVDVFEAMTHPRCHRQITPPHAAIKTLIALSKETFDSTILKKLIEVFSLYPIGSFVKLNTAEVCRVVSSSAEFPTRPIVEIIANADGKVEEQKRVINLADKPMLHISGDIDITVVKLDKKKLIQLKLSEWWIA